MPAAAGAALAGAPTAPAVPAAAERDDSHVTLESACFGACSAQNWQNCRQW